jgi:hypothetical protein
VTRIERITLLIEPPCEPVQVPEDVKVVGVRAFERYDRFAEALRAETGTAVEIVEAPPTAEIFARPGLVLADCSGFDVLPALAESAARPGVDPARTSRPFLLNADRGVAFKGMEPLLAAGAVTADRHFRWRAGQEDSARHDIVGLTSLADHLAPALRPSPFPAERYTIYEDTIEPRRSLPAILARYLEAYWASLEGRG